MRSLRDDGIYTNGEDEGLLEGEEGVPLDTDASLDEEGERGALEEPEVETEEEEEDAF